MLHNSIADVMKSAGSVVGVMNGISSDVTCVHVSSDVEVNGIPLTHK